MTNPNAASERASTAKKPATKGAKPAKRKPGAPAGAKVEKVDGNRQTREAGGAEEGGTREGQ